MGIQLNDILFYFVLLFSNLVQAITGFAGTLLAMPPSIKLVGPDTAKAVLSVVAQLSCLYIVLTGYKHVNWKEFFKMFLFMVIGMVIGIKIYQVMPLDFLLKWYGVLIILIAVKKLFIKKEMNLPKIILFFTVLCAGIIHGMFISGGALLVIYATAVLKTKEEFRVTLALMWVVLGFYVTGDAVLRGIFTSHTIFLTCAGMLFVFVGTWIGIKIVDKIKQETFMKLTYFLLIISGIMAIV